jgi:hypothetical protein
MEKTILAIGIAIILVAKTNAEPVPYAARGIVVSTNPDLLNSTSNSFGLYGAPEGLYSFTNDYGILGSPEMLYSTSNDYGLGLRINVVDPSFEFIEAPLEVP